MMKSLEVVFYKNAKGKYPLIEWLDSLDRSTRARIDQRILRLSVGNYGDYKYLNKGVYELRLAFGSGYRIYFGRDGDKIVVLLNGGDKKTQKRDIEAAIINWNEYQGG